MWATVLASPAKPTSSPPRLHRCSCRGGGECDNCRAQRLARTHAPAIVSEVLQAPGRPLEAGVRATMEGRLGHAFGRVRVHDDPRAAASAAAVASSAYTVGPHVVFGAGRYAPGTPAGDRLLTHELVHVLQQDGAAPVGPIEIASADGHAEREAQAIADGPAGSVASHGPTLMRQIVEPPVEFEPYDPEPWREAEEREREQEEAEVGHPAFRDGVPREAVGEIEEAWDEIARGEPEPEPREDEPPLGEERGSFLKALIGPAAPPWLSSARAALERLVVTLDRGGQPPSFVTEAPPRVHHFHWQGKTWPVTYRPRRFHVLDAIEYEVARARTESDLRRILAKHLGFWPEKLIIDPLTPLAPYFPDDLDPLGSERRRVFAAAVRARAAVVAQLATAPSAQTRRKRSKGGCDIEYGRTSLGGNAVADLFALSHCRFGDPLIGEARVTIRGPNGAPLDSVQYDGVVGDTAYECKCGYGWLADDFYSADPRKRARATNFLENPMADTPGRARRGEKPGLIVQLRHQQRVAADCGLDFQYVVSSGAFAQLLAEWAPSLKVECQSEPACGRGCDEGPHPDSGDDDDERFGPRPLRFDR